MTSSGMELATFRLVAQCLSQLRHHILLQIYVGDSKVSEILFFSPVSSTLFKTTTELSQFINLMFIGPCIIAIVDEWKTNLMSLPILFHLLCAQHVSDINISIFRSLRLRWWITTTVLSSVRCVLEFLLRLVFGGVRFVGWSIASACKTMLQPAKRTDQMTVFK